MRPARGDGLLTTAEAARMAGVKPATIRRWRSLGYLRTRGLDERGYPLHHRDDVREAERTARDRGVAGNGLDPRRQRGKPRGWRPSQHASAAAA